MLTCIEQVTAVLDQLQREIVSAGERVGPSVVGLGRGWGRGSGVIVAPGRVLTNAHVLRGDEVAVRFRDGNLVPGRLLGLDAALDIALIGADTGDAPAVAWEPEATPEVGIGAPVFAVADPGGRGLRVTLGFVSASGRSLRGPRGRRIAGVIEHTAALPRGASGSALVDARGRLLGINTLRQEGGLILAIPADAALKTALEGLARGGEPRRPRLGVALAPVRDGMLVRAVLDGSPAAAAGIRPGDLLVAAGGRPLTSVDELLDAMEAAGEDGLEIGLARGGERLTFSVRV